MAGGAWRGAARRGKVEKEMRMNDLEVVRNRISESIDRLQQMRTVDDVERLILQGQGLSACSYSTYMTGVRSAATFIGDKSPLEWSPEDIEAFYDATVKRCGISTATTYLAGLRHVFKRLSEMFAGMWETPFEKMSEGTTKKLRRNELHQTKLAMSQREVTALLAYRAADPSVAGLQTRAAVLLMLTTGLRAQEACDLTYNSFGLDTDNGSWTLSGIGKGGKPFYMNIHPMTMEAMTAAFVAQHGWTWLPGDYLLHSTRGRLKKPALWHRLKKLGADLVARGELRPSVEFSAHLFRRTFCTQMVKLGMPAHQVEEHLRYSSIGTLITHYIDDRESIMPYLDRLLGVAGLCAERSGQVE